MEEPCEIYTYPPKYKPYILLKEWETRNPFYISALALTKNLQSAADLRTILFHLVLHGKLGTSTTPITILVELWESGKQGVILDVIVMSACLLLSDEHRSMVLFHLPKGEGGDLAECANCLNWIMENRVSGGRPEISNRILETLSARGPPVLRVREYPEGRRDMFRGRQGNRNTMRRTNWTLLYL